MTESELDPSEEQHAGFEIAKDGISGLVVGYDATDPARDALALAIGVARRSNAKMTVVFVKTLPGAVGLSPSGYAATEDALDAVVEEIRQQLHGLRDELPEGTDLVVVEGDVATELERIADERRADIIVVGRSHSRTHQVAGSVTVHLVKHASRPVVVVP